MTEQCPMDLDSLSSVAGQSLINGSNLNLKMIYKSALLSSAHFRYMAEDWSLGESCLDTEQNLKMHQAFERYNFYKTNQIREKKVMIIFRKKYHDVQKIKFLTWL